MLTYLMFIIPGALLGIFAQMKVKSAYASAARIPAASGVSGAQAAAQILEANGISNVSIEQVPGRLSDHYDPRKKVLRLSGDVYNGRSLASLGIAAHEAGHAIQDAKNYAPLVIRNGIVPLASLGSNASFFVLFIGSIIGSMGLVLLGVALFSLVVIFQLVNLPVEFDASSRAKETLLKNGLISTEEHGQVSSVLSAAALTYVAATVTAVLTLLYYLVQLGILGGRSDD